MARPGTRRLFTRILDPEQGAFCKSSFLDIESPLPKEVNIPKSVEKAIKKYQKVILAFQPVSEEVSWEKPFKTFLAAYAQLRGWGTNEIRKSIKTELAVNGQSTEDQEEKVKNLLLARKYIVLQGAPGVGKTRIAKKISEELDGTVFFTQFHAQTSYSEFISGLYPKTDKDSLIYERKDGIFIQAIKAAQADEEKKVILIIDEINRANLSNVLGQAFYLFEYQMGCSGISIELSPGCLITSLPDNLYVIATMNTADRSLAVVDFALRRRFAWYSLRPEPIDSKELKKNEGKVFHEKDFNSISLIFETHASDPELDLQPGQGYFITSKGNSDELMKDRLRYELYPLIKEYLAEGLLLSAKEEFNIYFWKRIGLTLDR